MLNLDEVATFRAVSGTGSFTAAANRLHVTQSTISHQIKRLEERMGRQLLIRTTRSVKLTPAGERFLTYCSKLLELAQEAEQSISLEQITGEVRIGVPEEFAYERLAVLLSRFRLHYPKVRLYVEIGLGGILTEKLKFGDLDLVVRKQAPPSSECIRSEPLVWAGRNDVFDVDLLPLAFLPSPCSFRKVAIAAIEKSKREFAVIMTSASLEALRKTAEIGTVITVLPQSLCPPELVLKVKENELPSLPEMGYEMNIKSQPDKSIEIAAEIVHDLLVQEH